VDGIDVEHVQFLSFQSSEVVDEWWSCSAGFSLERLSGFSTTLPLVRSFLPWAKKEAAVALSIAFVADDGKTTAERRFKRLAIAALYGERKVSLLGVLFPLVDGVRDGNAFDDFD
jgi:hypothetical protein